MRVHDCEQGSAEWLRLRLGIPTASQFHKIVTPAKCELSKQARFYAYFLIAERLLNASLESVSQLEWIVRGRDLEPQALRLYEFEQDVVTKPVGLVTTDDGRMGASPDRLIEGLPAAVEIKCPAPQTHVGYLLEGFGLEYRVQAAGQLLIGEFEWVDRYSYHPLMPPVKERTYRDEAYLKMLRSALDQFCDQLDELMERARARGIFYERPQLLTPIDAMAEQMGGLEDPEVDRDAFGLLPLADRLQGHLRK